MEGWGRGMARALMGSAGFAGDARFDMAVTFGQICFSYILFISLVALLSGALNAYGRFTEAGFVPVLMNLMFIAAMGLAVWLGWDMGLTLAWTVPVTGVAQLAFTWVAASRIGFVPRLRMPQMTPDLKRLLIIAGPAMLAGGVVQVNLLVSRQVASGTEGAISWLVYADRLYQLPLGVVAIAVGTVLLPELSRRLRAGDAAGGQDAFNRGTEFALVLTLPSAMGLMVLSHPIIEVLYQRGAFGAVDTANTAPFELYGIVMDNEEPGIAYHSIGANGSSFRSNFRCDLFKQHLVEINPDLVIISIGTNDSFDGNFTESDYMAQYDTFIQMIRAVNSDAQFILTVPNDSYYKRKYPNLNTAKTESAIYKLALKHNALVWDCYKIMGGLRSSKKWMYAGMMKKDLIHFTYNGYILKGELFWDAFKRSYQNYLEH